MGPHALIEMDESASDLSQGVIALSNMAEQAGVNKFTGRWSKAESITDKQLVEMHRASSVGKIKEKFQVEGRVKERGTTVKRQGDCRISIIFFIFLALSATRTSQSCKI